MILRRELTDDHAAVFAVHAAAFAGDAGVPPAEARLVDDLRADGAAVPELTIVAVDDDHVVGHVMCSRGLLAGRPLLGLGPLGVLPAHQRRGVGQALMHGVLAAADALGEPAVVLLGDPRYYRRFGFVPSAPLGLLPPRPGWAQHFQVRRLTAWDGSAHGTYRFADAFDRV